MTYSISGERRFQTADLRLSAWEGCASFDAVRDDGAAVVITLTPHDSDRVRSELRRGGKPRIEDEQVLAAHVV